MCKWSPFVYAMQVLSRTKVTICTFAHSHICTLTKHLHINQAFAHSHILTLILELFIIQMPCGIAFRLFFKAASYGFVEVDTRLIG